MSVRENKKILQIVGGEGRFHAYKTLNSRRRFHTFLKYLLTSISHFTNTIPNTDTKAVILIKGPNQRRLFNILSTDLASEVGKFSLLSMPNMRRRRNTIGGFRARSLLNQTVYLFCMLATGQKRYLNLYYLEFTKEMRFVVEQSLASIDQFICFNDQPYDVAALLYALNSKPSCETVVIQHGLILSPDFYFPTNSKDFWAWGQLSYEHFTTNIPNGKMSIKGRFSSDQDNKAATFNIPSNLSQQKILIAPSHKFDEVKSLVLLTKAELQKIGSHNIEVSIKFHPATKFSVFIKGWVKLNLPIIKFENDDMESCVVKYDSLITKNSTSAVDFLLRGKPAGFSDFAKNGIFPSPSYGIKIRDVVTIGKLENFNIEEKNTARKNFLWQALNV